MDLSKVPELRKSLEFVTENQSLHDQTDWTVLPHPDSEEVVVENNVLSNIYECGAKACLAGWTVLNSPNYHVRQFTLSADYSFFGLTNNSGTLVIVTQAAIEILGLTMIEAVELFNGNNSLYDLWRIANRISEGQIEIPPGL
jgi:hypothetical protein